MARPEYSPTITLGNLLTIVLMVIGGFGAWNTVIADQRVLASQMISVQAALGWSDAQADALFGIA